MSQLRLKQILYLFSINPDHGDFLAYNSANSRYENIAQAINGATTFKYKYNTDSISSNGTFQLNIDAGIFSVNETDDLGLGNNLSNFYLSLEERSGFIKIEKVGAPNHFIVLEFTGNATITNGYKFGISKLFGAIEALVSGNEYYISFVSNGADGTSVKYATTFNAPHRTDESRSPSEDLGSLTVESGLSYIGGELITIVPVVSPENIQVARVTSYSGTTLTIEHISHTGTQPYSGSEDWNINLTGISGTSGTSVKYNTVFDAPHGTDESRSPSESLGSLTIETGLSYIGGEYITISPVVSPENIQVARVTSYNATTGVITFEHISHTGTQSYSGN